MTSAESYVYEIRNIEHYNKRLLSFVLCAKRNALDLTKRVTGKTAFTDWMYHVHG